MHGVAMSRAVGLRLHGKGEHLLFLAGINLMLLNFLLVQHATIAFRQAEIAVLVVSLSYFAGISLGYILSDRISLAGLRTLLPAFLIAQMAMIVLLQVIFDLVSDALGKWASYGMVFLLVTVAVTSVYSVFLPRIIETEGRGLVRCYSVEISGSILGLACVPVLAGFSHILLLAGYLVVFLGICTALGSSRVLLVGLAVAGAVFLGKFPDWDRATSTWFYRHWYRKDVRDVVYTRYTPYHKIEILDLGDGEHMLTLNGKRQFAKGSHYTYSYFVAEYPARLLGKPTVCVLGCGSMSTVGRIGDFVPSVRIVDLDPGVFGASRRFFRPYNRLDELDNWTFTADDAKHFVANTDERFDLILHDIPPAKSRQVALTYTEEFFTLVKERLTPRGIFSIASLTPFHSRSEYGKRLIATLAHVFDRYFILEYGRAVYFYGGGPGMRIPSREALLEAVDHRGRANVRAFVGAEVDELVAGAAVVSINNVGDLIYE